MKKRVTWIAIALLLSFVLVSCGRGGSSSVEKESTAAPESAGAYDSYESEEAYGDYEASADYDAAAEEAGVSAAAGSEAGGSYENMDKIVYSCNVTMQTLEYNETVASIRKKVKDAGGLLEQENETDDDYRWYYEDFEFAEGGSEDSESGGNRRLYLTVRIPTEKYESFIASLSEDGKILNKTQDAQNISRTYNDTQAVIEMLENEEKRLQDMMDKAETIEDMIAVESRLTEVQTELNQYRTHKEAMDTDLAYSTVTIEVEEVQRINDPVRVQDSFGQHVKKLFAKAWGNFASFWKYLVYVIVYLLPGIIVLLVALFIILFLTRKKRAAAKERRAQLRAAQKQMQQMQQAQATAAAQQMQQAQMPGAAQQQNGAHTDGQGDAGNADRP